MPTYEQARSWYTSSDTVHDFSHIERVYAMAEHLAQAEGADLEIVRTAALLHDVAEAAPGQNRAEHHLASADFAGVELAKEGWAPERIAAVQHCIRAHRFRSGDEAPETLEAKVIFDADKLDVLGATGVARTIAYAALAGQPAYVQPSSQFLETGKKETGEPHSAYHEYLFKLSKIKHRLFTPTARALAEARDLYLREFFAQLAAEMHGDR
jgi:uncharacterized protein